jgi:hypothetical protein
MMEIGQLKKGVSLQERSNEDIGLGREEYGEAIL